MTDKLERRFADGVAVDGRTLSGVAMRYGSEGRTPTGRRERFAPGAFGDVSTADVVLNVHHERSRPIARTGETLTLTDDGEELRMSATPPNTRDAKDAIALVQAGVLRGLSVEFRSLRERVIGGVRVIERAKLVAIGLVDTPAYDASTVAARSVETKCQNTPWWTL